MNVSWSTVALIVSLALSAASLLVAFGGFMLNRRAIGDEWAREWAAQRPVVYPLALHEWTHALGEGRYRGGNARLLPLKNGGRGPALDVQGEIQCVSEPDKTPYTRQILAAPIAAGDLFDAELTPHPGVVHWLGAEGVIRYRDLAGGSYETRFSCAAGPNGEITLRVSDPVSVSVTDSQ